MAESVIHALISAAGVIQFVPLLSGVARPVANQLCVLAQVSGLRSLVVALKIQLAAS